MRKEKAMTEEKKMTNEEIAESILGCCSCREDWAKRDMRDPECQWCENGELIVEALDEKDKEIARLRMNAIKFLDTELCEAHFQIAKNQSFDDYLKTQKEAGCRMCLVALLERRTGALKYYIDTCECQNDGPCDCLQARQALQDDGKEKI